MERVTAAASGLAFGVHAVLHLAARGPTIDGPVATTGYALLGLTMIGWSWRTARGSDERSGSRRR